MGNNNAIGFSQHVVNSVAGINAGVCTSLILHPIDRAIYLSMVNHRPFFKAVNFSSPFQGVMQSGLQKTFSNGFYFFLQIEIRDHLQEYLPQNMYYRDYSVQFGTGLMAGSISAILNNPFSAVKYYMWSKNCGNYYQCAVDMWNIGGCAPFKRGIGVSIARDSIQSCIYEILRMCIRNSGFMQELSEKGFFSNTISNLLAASTGIVLVSPLNYIRNRIFHSCPSANGIEVTVEMQRLWAKSGESSVYSSPVKQMMFFNNYFKPNLGVVRGAVSIMLAQEVSDATREYFAKPSR